MILFGLMGLTTAPASFAGDLAKLLSPFFACYWVDCHDEGAEEGGLSDDARDPATFPCLRRGDCKSTARLRGSAE